MEADLHGWASGPIPSGYGGILADDKTRRNYFSVEAGLALYGDEQSATRWHRILDERSSSCRVTGLELVRVPSSFGGGKALAVVHMEVPPEELLEKVVAASRKPRGGGADSFEMLFGAGAVLLPGAFTIAFRTFDDPDPLWPSSDYQEVVSATDLWSWCLASSQRQSIILRSPEILPSYCVRL